MRNIHKIVSDLYRMDTLYLQRDCKKLQIRDSDYRNQGIFTLRCISKGITLVSIRLKTTVRTEKARKIIRKAERDLLQTRVKSINGLLDNQCQTKDLWMSQLVSKISITSMQRCQELIDKVREFRYLKVRERQINKFNRLLQKEGNITWSSTPKTLTLNQGIAQAQAELTLSWEGVQAVQALNPRQAALTLNLEGVQTVQAHNPRQTRVFSPSNSASGATARDATSSPDNATGVTGEQGLRPGSTRHVAQHIQPKPSRFSSPIEGETTR